jgi:GNAT superfamily N-acetyltransferase
MGESGETPSQPFVRPARLIDAAAFAAVQHRSWAIASAAAGLPEPPGPQQLERAWERAITVPPSGRHHSWVAVDRSGDGEVVRGVAATAPASDPDLDAASVVEVVLLTVDPDARGAGHGSRLMTAALETAAANGDQEAVVWVASDDDLMRRFLESAGWAADGAYRTLAEGESTDESAHEVRQVRLATGLGTPG